MKLEDQLCNLELSKKLKELGIKQESLFFWEVLDENAYGIRFEVKFLPFSCPGIEKYSAFTASELLEMLPRNLMGNTLSVIPSEKHFCCRYDFMAMHYSCLDKLPDKNLANACAKMLIYLIENKLYDPNERPNLLMRPES